MLRKGFTLIELLVVITIIAILAGAALPYVQDYVEDARISKAKSDLGEIKNALVRWEVDNARFWPDADEDIDDLVGTYLEKRLIDPWGNPYKIHAPSSVVYCTGPSGAGDTTDFFSLDFRPPLAVSKAYWVDINKDGLVSTGDTISVRFTRPLEDEGTATNWKLSSPSVDAITVTPSTDKKSAVVTLDGVLAPMATGFRITPADDAEDSAVSTFGGPFKIQTINTYIKPL